MADWSYIAVRFALYADLTLLFGASLFGLYALDGRKPHRSQFVPFRRFVPILAAVGLGLSCLGLVIMGASMAGTTLSDVDRETLFAVVSQTSVGRAWQARIAALLLALLLSVVFQHRQAVLPILGSTAGAVALASLAWTGHAAASGGDAGVIHLLADILHLLAAGAWVGALFVLSVALFRVPPMPELDTLRTLHRALAGFSMLGTMIVGLIVVTGLVSSVFLVGLANVPTLTGSLYGRLLVLKVLLFSGMVGLAATNRFRLTPALEQAIRDGTWRKTVAALRRSLAVEAAAALLILGLVAWFGTLAPP